MLIYILFSGIKFISHIYILFSGIKFISHIYILFSGIKYAHMETRDVYMDAGRTWHVWFIGIKYAV
jgi:hypothetical protein